MKTLLALLFLVTGISAFSQNVITRAATANVASNYFVGRFFFDEITFANANTTNIAIVKFYDWATTDTNVVRGAYTSYLRYDTNYTVIHTNQAGLLATNTFVGEYLEAIANPAVTNEQTRFLEIQVPANQSLLVDGLGLLSARGLTMLPNQSGTVTIRYRTAQ